MKVMKNIFLITIITGLTFSGFFLDNGIGLKGMQVGRAYTANPKGAEALYWNVANLANMKKANVYTIYGEKQDWEEKDYGLMVALPINEGSAIGFAYYRSGVDNIIWRGSNGNLLSNFNFADEAYLLGYSQKLIGLDHSCGVTVKQINQKALSSTSYMSMDLAYQISLGLIKAGFVAEDVLLLQGGSDVKPRYRVGATTTIMGFNVNVDYVQSYLFNTGYLNYGVIYKGFPFMDLKSGYSEYDKNLYAGISLSMVGVKVDYLFSNQDIGVVHKFGLDLSF